MCEIIRKINIVIEEYQEDLDLLEEMDTLGIDELETENFARKEVLRDVLFNLKELVSCYA